MPSNQLTFDTKTHSATFNGQTLTLHPLSFKLLKVLADSDESTLSINEISSLVWSHGSASAETIKQRIFVLRKAIAESGIEGLVIQSIRGEGYRLIIEEKTTSCNKTHRSAITAQSPPLLRTRAEFINNIFNRKIVILIMISMLALGSIFYLHPSNHPYKNNRIALWTNQESHLLPRSAASLYNMWNKKLMKEMEHNSISLVFSDKQKETLVPVQARRNRLAIVSYFEVLSKHGKTIVNMSIVEPKTATILRTNTFELTNDWRPASETDEILSSQLKGIIDLIESESLHLTKEHRENPTHHIWQQLKDIANNNKN